MRIAFIDPYPALPGELAVGGPRYRDEALTMLLSDLGHQVTRLLASRTQPMTFVDSFGAAWRTVRVDAHQEHVPDAQLTSSELVHLALSAEPEALVLRAAGTKIGSEIVEATHIPVVTILGGAYRTPKVLEAELLLTEAHAQESYLRPRAGRGRLIRLAKLPDPHFAAQGVAPMASRTTDIAVLSAFKPHKNLAAILGLLKHPLRIVAMGDGPLRAEIEARSHDCRAEVRFLGAVPPQIVASELGNSRVLAHPSLSEGFPRAVAEAMVVGTPVVGFRDVLGPPVIHDVNGLLTDRSEFIQALVSLLGDDSERLDDLSAGAVRTSREHFSIAALRRSSMELDAQLRALSTRRPVVRRFDATVRTTRRFAWQTASRTATGLRRRLAAGARR